MVRIVIILISHKVKHEHKSGKVKTQKKIHLVQNLSIYIISIYNKSILKSFCGGLEA